MFGLWKWLRDNTRAAILGGVNDAVAELTAAQLEGAAPPVTLRLTFTPEAKDVEEEPTAARRKAAK